MRSLFSMAAGRRRGSVIVLVLGLVTLAAFLLSQFIERAMTEMLVESRARQADRLRTDAHSVLEASLAVLADYQALDGGLRAPAQGWGEPLAEVDFVVRSGTEVTVEVDDESGLISLPRLGASELAALGRQLGMKEADAARLADAILTWTSREHASTRMETDPRNYEYADPPHRPPGRPISSFGELAAIAGAREFFYTPEGRPTKLHEDFVRSVSLHQFPTANLNSARPATLALAGLDETLAKEIIAYQIGRVSRPAGSPPYFRSMAEAQALLGVTVPVAGFDTLARCLRVRVTVQEGGTSFHLTAVVAPIADASPKTNDPATSLPGGTADLRYPFKVLAFEENIELAPAPAS